MLLKNDSVATSDLIRWTPKYEVLMHRPSSYLFLKLHSGGIVAWNYRDHRQYVLTQSYLDRLMFHARQEPVSAAEPAGSDEAHQIDEEMLSAGLLVESAADDEEWGWDQLSHIFHFGTRDVPISSAPGLAPDDWVDEYLDYCAEIAARSPQLFRHRAGRRLALPPPVLGDLESDSLLTVLTRRKTCRDFYSRPISIAQLSTLLFVSFGDFHGSWVDLARNDLELTGLRKTSPSGGGLHTSEAYVVALRVTDLNPGLYHYDVTEHALSELELGDLEDRCIGLLYDQYYARGMAVGVFLASRLDKAWWKYPHSRAYRNVLLDVGHVSQTFQLCATALGLSTWLTGAFHDSAVDKMLRITEESESVMFFVGAGVGSGKTFDHIIERRIKARAGRPPDGTEGREPSGAVG